MRYNSFSIMHLVFCAIIMVASSFTAQTTHNKQFSKKISIHTAPSYRYFRRSSETIPLSLSRKLGERFIRHTDLSLGNDDNNWQNLKRRKSPNNRVAIRWVVESIENIIKNDGFENGLSPKLNTSDDDDSLIEGLYMMLHGKF